MMFKDRLLIYPPISLIVAAMIFVGCADGDPASRNGEPERQPVSVQIASTRVQPVQRTVEVVGTLYGDESATISAKVAGRMLAIYHDVGDRVLPNVPLAQIDRTDYELNAMQRELTIQETLAQLGLDAMPTPDFPITHVPTVVRAQRQAANAEARLNRARQLFEQEQPLISEQDYADLETAFDVARSDYEVALLQARSLLAQAHTRRSEFDVAQQRLRDTLILAPAMSSEDNETETQPLAIAARHVTVGEYVREGTPLFDLVADHPIKFRAPVPERYSARIKTGQIVDIFVEAYAESFEGSVARINPRVDPASRTFQIEVLIDNRDHRLRPGSFARGRILTHMEPNITFAPRQAVMSFAGVKKLFTIVEGKAVEIPIETGVRVGDYTEITRGLTGEHDVAITGINALASGTPVTPIKPNNTNPDKAASLP